MPKRLRNDEEVWGVREASGAESEPLNKQLCGPNHQVNQYGKFFNNSTPDVSMNPNNNNEKKHNVDKKKNLKQMLIGNNLHLYADAEMMIHPSVANMCALCKIHISENEATCSYCEVLQCCLCAMVCSVCLLPTCAKCSINSFAGLDRVFCLSCCR